MVQHLAAKLGSTLWIFSSLSHRPRLDWWGKGLLFEWQLRWHLSFQIFLSYFNNRTTFACINKKSWQTLTVVTFVFTKKLDCVILTNTWLIKFILNNKKICKLTVLLKNYSRYANFRIECYLDRMILQTLSLPISKSLPTTIMWSFF